MDRFVGLDATAQTLSAHLHPDERILLHQDGVGLYDGKDKSPPHYDGRLHLTSHRLIFLSSTTPPHSSSAALDLSLVKQTEYWTGFLKSNPKITLLLAAPPTPPQPTSSTAQTISDDTSLSPVVTPAAAAGSSRNWVCRVCGMKNLPSTQLGAKCSLCGVARDRPSSSSSPLPPSPLPSRTATPRLDRDQYLRNGTPPPLPPPPTSSITLPETPVPASTTTTTDRRLACPVCTFLNHHSMSSCEVCDSPLTPLPSSSTATPPSLSRSSTPAPSAEPGGGGASFVRLSFRKGGERAFYAALKEALGKKEWEWDGGEGGGKKARNGNGGEGGAGGGGGIDAIMRNISLDTQERDEELDDALKDLNALMGKAKEMILLAQSMNSRLSSTTPSTPNSSADPTPAAASTLVSLGLVSAPITSDQIDSEEKYHHELAKELGKVLGGKGGLMDKRGVVGLDEVWCLWNRARGVSLIPPSALSLSAPHLPLYTTSPGPQIRLHTFPSGLTILHTPYYSSRAFQSRVLELLDLRQALSLSAAQVDEQVMREGLTTLEVMKAEEEQGVAVGVGLALVKEMLEEVEMRGELIRDEQGGEGIRWWRNGIKGWEWDGHVF